MLGVRLPEPDLHGQMPEVRLVGDARTGGAARGFARADQRTSPRRSAYIWPRGRRTGKNPVGNRRARPRPRRRLGARRRDAPGRRARRRKIHAAAPGLRRDGEARRARDLYIGRRIVWPARAARTPPRPHDARARPSLRERPSLVARRRGEIRLRLHGHRQRAGLPRRQRKRLGRLAEPGQGRRGDGRRHRQTLLDTDRPRRPHHKAGADSGAEAARTPRRRRPALLRRAELSEPSAARREKPLRQHRGARNLRNVRQGALRSKRPEPPILERNRPRKLRRLDSDDARGLARARG